MSIYFSPAKLNLFFRVLSKRKDGFHEIASLYTAIDFGDYLSFQHSEEDSFQSNDCRLLNDQSNLIVKAREIFRSRLKTSWPIDIHLIKNIPFGSGLGGGSGNAATTLWGLNEFYRRPFDVIDLKEMAAELGSDVAFFFSKGIAYCTGRGEKVFEVDFELNQSFWLAVPDELSISTPSVYKKCKPNEVSIKHPEDLLDEFSEGSFEFVNDLSPAAHRVSPMLEELEHMIRAQGFSMVCMTGSGSTLFCIGEDVAPSVEGVRFIKVDPLTRLSEDHWFPLSRSEASSEVFEMLKV